MNKNIQSQGMGVNINFEVSDGRSGPILPQKPVN